MATWVKRGKRYRVRFYDPDGTERSVTVRTVEKAKELCREIEDCVDLGRRWTPRDGKDAARLEDLVAAFDERNVRVLQEATRYRYGKALALFQRFLGDKGHRPNPSIPSVFTQKTLADFYKYLADEKTGRHGRKRSPDTVRKNVEVIQLLWEFGANDDRFVDHLAIPRRLEMVRTLPMVPVAATFAEADRVIASMMTWKRKALIIERFTGLRVGQVMRLRRDDLDEQRGWLTIRPDLGKMLSEKRGRVIPVSKHLLDEMATWDRDDDWLVAPPTALKGVRERAVRAKEVRAAWLRAGVRARIWRGRPNHALRKTFVTELRALGANGDAVEYYVGHNLGLVSVYSDPRAFALQDVADRVPPLAPEASMAALKQALSEAKRPQDGQ